MNYGYVHFTKMMWCLLLLLFLPLLHSCNETTEQQTENTETTNSPTPPAAQSASTTSTGQEDSPIGTRAANVTPQAAQNPLTLGLSNERVKSGEEVCLNVQVADFNALLSMQYSIKWDPKVLQFVRTDGYQLAGVGPQNFGAHRTAEGLLTGLWIDNNLQGVTLSDGATIYQVCFKAVGKAGQQTEVSFVDGPTPFEVINLKSELVGLKPVAGRVTIQ
jgi:hypothetical protein